MPQTSIPLAPSSAYAGQIAEAALPLMKRSARTEGAAVSAGMPVKRGTDTETQVKPFGSGDAGLVNAQTFAGVVVLETSRPSDEVSPIADDKPCSIMRLGSIYMNFAAAVDAGQGVQITLSSGALSGYDEGDALASGHERLPGLRIVETLDAAGLAIVEVSIGAVSAVEGDDLLVGDDLTVTDDASIGGDLTVVGDMVAAGGFRQAVGPFVAPGALGVTAADQTNLDLRHAHTVTAYASGWVAPRAGSITGLSASLSAAITGSSKTLIAKVTVNGTEVGAALNLTFTTGGAETALRATQAKDVAAFAAGDVIGVSYTSTTITNTPALVADLEVEC